MRLPLCNPVNRLFAPHGKPIGLICQSQQFEIVWIVAFGTEKSLGERFPDLSGGNRNKIQPAQAFLPCCFAMGFLGNSVEVRKGGHGTKNQSIV